MSNRPPNDRPGSSSHEVSSSAGGGAYKRTRSPIASAGHTQSGAYPYAFMPPYEALYGHHAFQQAAQAGDRAAQDYRAEQRYREQLEMQPAAARCRPSMLSEVQMMHDQERENLERYYQAGGTAAPPTVATSVSQSAHELSAANAQSSSSGGPTAYKRPRLDIRPELTQPLRIDTGRAEVDKHRMAPGSLALSIGKQVEPAYTPQVEAISPTLPPEEKWDEISHVKSYKEELLSNIHRVDKEITKLETKITSLNKKQTTLEVQAKIPPEERTEGPESEGKSQSIAQIIYAENRKKAQKAHAILEKCGPKVEPLNLPCGMSLYPIQPLYNQPSDTAVYHQNKRNHQLFKGRLLTHLRKQKQAQHIREKYLAERYEQLLSEWVTRQERLETSTKRRAKDAKTREYFEKVFPELRKQREDKERLSSGNRPGVARSDAELEHIMDGLHEQEEEDKQMRAYAIVPPMMLDDKTRKLRFYNNNGLVDDPLDEHKEIQNVNVWTQQEKEIFKEKYLQHPKNFGYIASFLERKSVQDCVQYYYLSKKTEGYKQIVKRQNNRKKKIVKPPLPAPPAASVIEEPEKFEVKEEKEVPTTSTDVKPMETEASSTSGGRNTPEVSAALATGQPVKGESKAEVKVKTEPDSGGVGGGVWGQSEPTAGEEACVKSEVKVEIKTEPGVDKTKGPTASTSTEGGKHLCAACNTEVADFGLSRPLVKKECTSYGVAETSWRPDMRVCSKCRCKSVQRRLTPCQVPSCKTPKRKVKRLRPLPVKLQDLSPETRDAIYKELQLSAEVRKCCSSCFNRIARKIGNNPQTNEPLVPLVPEGNDDVAENARWTDEEMSVARQGLRAHGREWPAISALVGTKSESQCKNFYFNYKKKLGLEGLVHEYKVNRAQDKRKVSVCESVASTISVDHPSEEELSSDDEDNCEDNGDSSDTASAPSPSPPAVPTPPVQRPKQDEPSAKPMDKPEPSFRGRVASLHRTSEGYDSAATLSADEGPPGGDHSQLSPHHKGHYTQSERHPHPSSAPAPMMTSSAPTGGTLLAPQPPFLSYTGAEPRPDSRHSERAPEGYAASPRAIPALGSAGTGPAGSSGGGGAGHELEHKACVRDLIHNAIERNLQCEHTVNPQHQKPMDKTFLDPTGGPRFAHSHAALIEKEVEKQRLAGMMSLAPPSQSQRTNQRASPHAPLYTPPMGSGQQQHMPRDMNRAQQLWKDDQRARMEGGRDPREFEQRDMRRDDLRGPPGVQQTHPPAQSRKPDMKGLPASDQQRMYAEAERRSQPPPNRSNAQSPYSAYSPAPSPASAPGGVHHLPRDPQGGPAPPGRLPPALINYNDPGAGGKRGQSPRHLHGSISQGTPSVPNQQQPSPQPRGSGGGAPGSISMGTPRYADQRQPTPPQTRDIPAGGGSISRGTPVSGYETPRLGAHLLQQYGPGLDMYRAQYPNAAVAAAAYDSRAQLAGDFYTAKQMDESRRNEGVGAEKSLSPRTSRESGPYAQGVKDARSVVAMPTPMYNYPPGQQPGMPRSCSPVGPRGSADPRADQRADYRADSRGDSRDSLPPPLHRGGLLPPQWQQGGGGGPEKQPSSLPPGAPGALSHPTQVSRANVIVDRKSPRQADSSPRYDPSDPLSKAATSVPSMMGQPSMTRPSPIKDIDRGMDPRDRAMDPRDCGMDTRDRGMDPRDPSVDPRDRAMDPRDRGMDPRDRGMDPRDRAMDQRLAFSHEHLQKIEQEKFLMRQSELRSKELPESQGMSKGRLQKEAEKFFNKNFPGMSSESVAQEAARMDLMRARKGQMPARPYDPHDEQRAREEAKAREEFMAREDIRQAAFHRSGSDPSQQSQGPRGGQGPPPQTSGPPSRGPRYGPPPSGPSPGHPERPLSHPAASALIPTSTATSSGSLPVSGSRSSGGMATSGASMVTAPGAGNASNNSSAEAGESYKNVTAATLIDAIITHQINSNRQSAPPQKTSILSQLDHERQGPDGRNGKEAAAYRGDKYEADKRYGPPPTSHPQSDRALASMSSYDLYTQNLVRNFLADTSNGASNGTTASHGNGSGSHQSKYGVTPGRPDYPYPGSSGAQPTGLPGQGAGKPESGPEGGRGGYPQGHGAYPYPESHDGRGYAGEPRPRTDSLPTQEDMRPRSYSSGGGGEAHDPKAAWKRYEQESCGLGPQTTPPAQPARSPVNLGSDEREIIKVARNDPMLEAQARGRPDSVSGLNRSDAMSARGGALPPTSMGGPGGPGSGQGRLSMDPGAQFGNLMNRKIGEELSHSGGGGGGLGPPSSSSVARSTAAFTSAQQSLANARNFLRERYIPQPMLTGMVPAMSSASGHTPSPHKMTGPSHPQSGQPQPGNNSGAGKLIPGIPTPNLQAGLPPPQSQANGNPSGAPSGQGASYMGGPNNCRASPKLNAQSQGPPSDSQQSMPHPQTVPLSSHPVQTGSHSVSGSPTGSRPASAAQSPIAGGEGGYGYSPRAYERPGSRNHGTFNEPPSPHAPHPSPGSRRPPYPSSPRTPAASPRPKRDSGESPVATDETSQPPPATPQSAPSTRNAGGDVTTSADSQQQAVSSSTPAFSKTDQEPASK